MLILFTPPLSYNCEVLTKRKVYHASWGGFDLTKKYSEIEGKTASVWGRGVKLSRSNSVIYFSNCLLKSLDTENMPRF